MAIALITGRNSGIGKATALLFAQRGYKVAIEARGVEALAATQQQIEAQGGSVLAIATDVSCSSSVNQLVEQVIGQWGQIDLLVHAAGIISIGHLFGYRRRGVGSGH